VTSLVHLGEITALQDDYENAESEALKTITDQPALVSQTADRLAAYLVNIADSGDASDFDDQVSSYCARERTTDESYKRILRKMRDRSLLNAVGRNLFAVAGHNPQQRWKEFLRTLVEGTKKDPHERASEVVSGLNRERMALALEYAMGTPVGLQIALKAQAHMEATTQGPKTIANFLQDVMSDSNTLTSVATTLLQWTKTRQPLDSFQAWIKQITLESRNQAGSGD
jgi:hypothetical protein